MRWKMILDYEIRSCGLKMINVFFKKERNKVS